MSIKQPDNSAFRLKSMLIPLVGILILIAALYVFYVHIEGRLIDGESKFFESILLAILSSLIVTMFLDFFLKRDFVQLVGQQSRASISEVVNAQSNIQENGLSNVHKGLPYERFLPVLEVAREAVILQTFVPDPPSLLDEVRTMAKNRGKTRILMLNPASPLVAIRAQGLERTEKYVKDGILRALEDFFNLKEENGCENGIEIRLYDTIPSVSIYRADNMMFIGHYLQGAHAMEGPQLELSAGKYYFDIILAHFDAIWEKATVVSNNLLWSPPIDENKPRIT